MFATSPTKHKSFFRHAMKTNVQEWDNSTVVCIQKSLLKEVGLEVDSIIEINVVAGRLVIVPVKEGMYSLDSLLAGVTPENRYTEIDFCIRRMRWL